MEPFKLDFNHIHEQLYKARKSWGSGLHCTSDTRDCEEGAWQHGGVVPENITVSDSKVDVFYTPVTSRRDKDASTRPIKTRQKVLRLAMNGDYYKGNAVGVDYNKQKNKNPLYPAVRTYKNVDQQCVNNFCPKPLTG